MSKYFQHPFFNNPFFNQPFFKDNDFFKEPFFTGIGGITPPVTNPVVPKVLTSTIAAKNSKRIIVEFDQEMRGKGDIRQALEIIVDGGAPLVASSVSFSHHFMSLVFSSGFAAGQVISWKYDDTQAGLDLESTAGVKADNQTYAVTNNLVAVTAPPAPPADDILDLDGDGIADEVIGTITEDADSINIDLDNDGVADVVIKKKKKKNKKKDK